MYFVVDQGFCELMAFRHLAGFTWAADIDPEKEFKDEFFVDYNLVLSPSEEMDPYHFTGKPDFHRDTKGLRW